MSVSAINQNREADSHAAKALEPSFSEELLDQRCRLVAKLTAMLSLRHAKASDFRNVPEVIQRYNDDLVQIRCWHREANSFLTAVSEAHVVASVVGANRPEKLQASATQARAQVLALATLSPVETSSHLHAEILDDEVADAFHSFADDARQAVANFVDDLLGVLQTLADHHVLGRIVWPVSSGCRFRHYETRVYEGSYSKEKSGNRFAEGETTIERGIIEHRREIHQQQLAFATRQRLPQYKELIPSRVRMLLLAVPRWLRSEIEIVQGDLFRSDQGVQLLKREEWSETSVYYHEDPAATLGPFVLACWLCEEREREIHGADQQSLLHAKQLQAERIEHVNLYSKWAAIAIASQLVTLLLHFAGLILSPLHPLAMVFSLLLLTPLHEALRHYSLAHDVKSDAYYYIQGFVSGAFLALAVQAAQLGLLYGSWLAGLGAIAMLSAAVTFGASFFRQYPSTLQMR